MEPREYLTLLRRRWWIILGMTLLGAAVAWVTAPAQVAPRVMRFEAVNTLIVEPEARDFTPENPNTIALMAESGEVPRRVAERLGESQDEPTRLLNDVTIVGDGELQVINITAIHRDPERAALLADTFAQELIGYLDEQEGASRLREIDAARAQVEEFQRRVEEVSQQIATGADDPAVLEERRLILVNQYGDALAQYEFLLTQPMPDSGLKSLGNAVPKETRAGIQAPRSRTERAMILGFIGAMLASAMVIVIERLDVRIKTKEDAETAFRLPVIAEIPQMPLSRRRAREVVSHTQPASSIAEAYRGLRTTLLILKPTPLAPLVNVGATAQNRRASDPHGEMAVEREQQVFLVTSTRPSEGKTSTVANLAAAFAEAGRSVLVIGGDVRRPEVHEYLGTRRDPGISEVLSGGYSAPSLADVIVPTAIPGVSLAPAGSHVSNPGEVLLQGAEMLAEARNLADVVLVDTTPMLTVNDAILLMPEADAVIVTCRAGRGTVEAARRAHETLARLRVPVAGVVLIGAPETPGVASYYYGYQTGVSNDLLGKLRRRLRRLDREAAAVAAAQPPPMRRSTPPAPVAPPAAAPAPEPHPAPVHPPAATSSPSSVPAPNGGNGHRTTEHREDDAAEPPARVNGAASRAADEVDPWGWP